MQLAAASTAHRFALALSLPHAHGSLPTIGDPCSQNGLSKPSRRGRQHVIKSQLHQVILFRGSRTRGLFSLASFLRCGRTATTAKKTLHPGGNDEEKGYLCIPRARSLARRCTLGLFGIVRPLRWGRWARAAVTDSGQNVMPNAHFLSYTCVVVSLRCRVFGMPLHLPQLMG